MGIVAKGFEKAVARQEKGIRKEAAKAKVELLDVQLLAQDAGMGLAVTSSMKSLFGGKTKVSALQTYKFRTGMTEHIYVQPYDGYNPLPGEHHVILPGTPVAPAALCSAMFSNKWKSPDAEYAKSLNKTLKKINGATQFEWPVGMAKIELEWAIQLYGRGGASHLVLKPGRYGGMTSVHVGLSHLRNIINAVQPLLGDNGAHQESLYPLSYTDLAFELLGLVQEAPAATETAAPEASAAEASASAAPAASASYSQVITSRFEPHRGKKVMVGEYPAKKENNVRTNVLEGAAAEEPMIAVVDLTTFGSAKDAVVLTASHCYAKEMDTKIDFPLSDVVGVGGFAGMLKANIKVHLRDGEIKLPCGNEDAGAALLAAFDGVASLNA